MHMETLAEMNDGQDKLKNNRKLGLFDGVEKVFIFIALKFILFLFFS